jgi:hypothetical protein
VISCRMTYKNGTADVVRLVLEPWAYEYAVQPGQKVEIRFSGGEADEPIELDDSADRLTIWGIGDQASVSSGGKEMPMSFEFR